MRNSLLRQVTDFQEAMIQFTANHRNEIGAHGERAYPHECCGLLLGRFDENNTKVVSEIYPIPNAREETAKRKRFLIRPDELMRGERYAETKALEIVGFYHSHPDHPAVPSQYDLDHAWPVYSYIVVSVRAGEAQDLRSWEMTHDRARFEEEDVNVIQTLAVAVSVPPAVAGQVS